MERRGPPVVGRWVGGWVIGTYGWVGGRTWEGREFVLLTREEGRGWVGRWVGG